MEYYIAPTIRSGTGAGAGHGGFHRGGAGVGRVPAPYRSICGRTSSGTFRARRDVARTTASTARAPSAQPRRTLLPGAPDGFFSAPVPIRPQRGNLLTQSTSVTSNPVRGHRFARRNRRTLVTPPRGRHRRPEVGSRDDDQSGRPKASDPLGEGGQSGPTPLGTPGPSLPF